MKIGLIIALIVVLAGGAFWLMSKGSNNTTTTDTTTETSTDSSSELPAADQPTDQTEADTKSVTVTFTDAGFSPSDITINLGDSVVFINESSSSFWPASDPHPTHTRFGEFDANAAVPGGQSYTFTFTKVGTWGYHDHLDSDKKGTVTVK